MECLITKDELPFDEFKPNEYKKYTLKLIDLCNEEKYSFTVNVKNSKAEPKKDGIYPALLIVLLIVVGLIIIIVIVFFVRRAIKRKGDIIVIGETPQDVNETALMDDK